MTMTTAGSLRALASSSPCWAFFCLSLTLPARFPRGMTVVSTSLWVSIWSGHTWSTMERGESTRVCRHSSRFIWSMATRVLPQPMSMASMAPRLSLMELAGADLVGPGFGLLLRFYGDGAGGHFSLFSLVLPVSDSTKIAGALLGSGLSGFSWTGRARGLGRGYQRPRPPFAGYLPAQGLPSGYRRGTGIPKFVVIY